MFDLKAGVDLKEGDVTGGADEELTGARADIPSLLEDLLGGAHQLIVLGVGEEGGTGQGASSTSFWLRR